MAEGGEGFEMDDLGREDRDEQDQDADDDFELDETTYTDLPSLSPRRPATIDEALERHDRLRNYKNFDTANKFYDFIEKNGWHRPELPNYNEFKIDARGVYFDNILLTVKNKPRTFLNIRGDALRRNFVETHPGENFDVFRTEKMGILNSVENEARKAQQKIERELLSTVDPRNLSRVVDDTSDSIGEIIDATRSINELSEEQEVDRPTSVATQVEDIAKLLDEKRKILFRREKTLNDRIKVFNKTKDVDLVELIKAKKEYEETTAALKTIYDQIARLSNVRELAGFDKAMQQTSGELKLNLARLRIIDDEIKQTKSELAEATNDEELQELNERLIALDDERSARLTLVRENERALKNQLARIKETFKRILESDIALREKIKALFREQGVTIVSVLAAFVLAIGTIVSSIIAAVGGGVAAVVTPTLVPPKPGGDGVKDWISNHLKKLANLLKKIGGKLLAALPGILGSIASWLFNLLSKTVGWLAEHVWALLIGVGTLILVYLQKNLK